MIQSHKVQAYYCEGARVRFRISAQNSFNLSALPRPICSTTIFPSPLPKGRGFVHFGCLFKFLSWILDTNYSLHSVMRSSRVDLNVELACSVCHMQCFRRAFEPSSQFCELLDGSHVLVQRRSLCPCTNFGRYFRSPNWGQNCLLPNYAQILLKLFYAVVYYRCLHHLNPHNQIALYVAIECLFCKSAGIILDNLSLSML